MNHADDRKKTLMELAVLAAWAAFFAFILASHRLPLYINPKFTLLPALGAAILVAMIAASIFGKAHEGHEHPIGWSSGSWNMLPIILGIVVAPASLGSFVASERGGIQTDGLGNSGIMLNLASTSEFQDVTIRQLSEAGKITAGKVCVEGQIPEDATPTGKNQCPLIHYVMTCCVADLRVVGITLKYPVGYKPTPGQWVRVRGTADRSPTGVEITAQSIEPISEPDPPYLY